MLELLWSFVAFSRNSASLSVMLIWMSSTAALRSLSDIVQYFFSYSEDYGLEILASVELVLKVTDRTG